VHPAELMEVLKEGPVEPDRLFVCHSRI